MWNILTSLLSNDSMSVTSKRKRPDTPITDDSVSDAKIHKTDEESPVLEHEKCMICHCRMQFPAWWGCRQHLSCYACAQTWRLTGYFVTFPIASGCSTRIFFRPQDLMPRLHTNHTHTGVTNCPGCKTGPDDVLILSQSILEYSKAPKWCCPYCNLRDASPQHVEKCDQYKVNCPVQGCGGKIPFHDPKQHFRVCRAYQCFDKQCPEYQCPMDVTKYILHMYQHQIHHRRQRLTQGMQQLSDLEASIHQGCSEEITQRHKDAIQMVSSICHSSNRSGEEDPISSHLISFIEERKTVMLGNNESADQLSYWSSHKQVSGLARKLVQMIRCWFQRSGRWRDLKNGRPDGQLRTFPLIEREDMDDYESEEDDADDFDGLVPGDNDDTDDDGEDDHQNAILSLWPIQDGEDEQLDSSPRTDSNNTSVHGESENSDSDFTGTESHDGTGDDDDEEDVPTDDDDEDYQDEGADHED